MENIGAGPESCGAVVRQIADTKPKSSGTVRSRPIDPIQSMRGWRGYFGFCQTPEELIALTRWVRLRLRAALWRQWKTPRRRRAALIALGVRGELRNMAGSGHGPWHLARSKALSVGLSNAHFKSLGLPSCSARVSATSRTAVYGPVRTVVWEGRSREAPPYPDSWPVAEMPAARPDGRFLGNTCRAYCQVRRLPLTQAVCAQPGPTSDIRPSGRLQA
jgi:Group II intron, maturase-specific domain